MPDKELITLLIDTYANLRRILATDNPKEEAEYQLKLAAAKPEATDIMTAKLDKEQNL